MGALFTSASSTKIANTSPVLVATGSPICMAAWHLMSSTTGPVIGFYDIATSNWWYELRLSGTGTAIASSMANGVERTATSTVSGVNGQWVFALARFISDSNRWISILNRAGQSEHIQNTTSNVMSAVLDNICIGARNVTTPVYTSGTIAEVWYTDADIWPDPSSAIDDMIFRQIAFKGPFSIPELSDSIVEYRSLRKSIDSTTDEAGDGNVYSRVGLQTWTQTNSPILSQHPPLAFDFVSPNTLKPIIISV
jgi:hypothetical protein